jgi:hypothetical protein
MGVEQEWRRKCKCPSRLERVKRSVGALSSTVEERDRNRELHLTVALVKIWCLAEYFAKRLSTVLASVHPVCRSATFR